MLKKSKEIFATAFVSVVRIGKKIEHFSFVWMDCFCRSFLDPQNWNRGPFSLFHSPNPKNSWARAALAWQFHFNSSVEKRKNHRVEIETLIFRFTYFSLAKNGSENETKSFQNMCSSQPLRQRHSIEHKFCRKFVAVLGCERSTQQLKLESTSFRF